MNRKFIFGSCAIVIGLVLGIIGLWILLSPVEYQATVKIEIEPDTTSDVPYMAPDNDYDPYFFETEFKAMVSEVVLSNVVETLNLNTQWGKRYGRTLETTEAIKLLRPQIDLSVRRNTKIVEIRVTDKDPNEAAKIANTIAEAYKDYRFAHQAQLRAAGIKMLEKVYAKEEAKISLLQSNLDIKRGQLPINDTDPNYAGPSPTIDSEQRQHLKEVLKEDEADYLKMKNEFAELQSLQATNPAALREILPMMCNDSVLSNLLGDLGDKTRKLAAGTNGIGGASYDRIAIQASITDLNGKIDARVNGIMSTLKVKVDGAKAAMDALNRRLKELETEGQSYKAEGQPYWEAKDKLDQGKEALELLKAKIEADSVIPKDVPVKVIDPAISPTAPSGPNRMLGTFLLIGGLLTSGFGFYSLREAGIREETKAKPV